MSDYESHRGKLIPVPFNEGEDLESACKRILQESDIELDTSCYGSIKEQLEDEFYNELLVLNNCIYKISSYTEGYEDTFIHMTKDLDGSINFSTRFYNGGTYLTEMLEKGIEKLK